MRLFRLTMAGTAALAAAAGNTIVPGDARRGSAVFERNGCVQCHSINGKGGTVAPDLGKRIDRNYTPAVLASTMWNHAPAMWSAMRSRGITPPKMSPETAADLFAYFMSTHYFERPGDAARGKQLFTARHCAECHGITTSNAAGAPPVAKWESLADPTVLAEQMWNHGPAMRQAFQKRNLKWVQLTSQELTDILVYLQNLPETRDVAKTVSFPEGGSGQALFESRGCVKCHVGANALEKKLRNQTMTDIAVDMWNHQPRMQNPPPTLTADEMRQILAYIWAKQYFQSGGNAERGKKVFEEKKCAGCHNPSGGAPDLAARKGTFSDITMMSVLWEHGPRMLERMQQRSIEWPRLTPGQMQDLIAYLNAK